MTLQDFVSLGGAQVHEVSDSSIQLDIDNTTVLITALAPDVFRVGMFPLGRPIEFESEAIAKTNWDAVATTIAKADGLLSFQTGDVTAHISLHPLRISFEDMEGRRFAEDDSALGMGTVGAESRAGIEDVLGPALRLYKRHGASERYFGCGERTGGLDKTGSNQIFWNIDPPGGHTAEYNNMYSSIPFVLALENGKAWGLFLDSSYRTEFDLAHENDDRSWFETAGGNLVYYVFAGPSVRAVLDRYTELTGRTPMPPMWSLGYQQSRYSYMDERELRNVARTFREREIPCDVLYLDIHYMDGYRVFTWDSERFPDPPKLLADLREQGFHVVTIIDPGVKVDKDYPVYVQGQELQAFCGTAQRDEFQNVVWPGTCAFPDFTSASTRAWWGRLHGTLIHAGVAGIWCDMNEPALFIPSQSTMPGDVVHGGDGNRRVHAQVHNLYGLLMARATREGLAEIQPDRRPFVISRSGYAGLQRFALQWTGDNSSWWEHLWMSMPQLQNMGLSGLAWVGVDIGGFIGDTTAELLTRWMEFGVFQPFCRNHTTLGTRSQEPWAFGEPYESHMREMIRLRQRLLPYLYTVFEESHRTGAPILRPLLFEYQEDEATYNVDDEFLVGRNLLVAPISRRGQDYRHVYLPDGTWFHFWTGEKFHGPVHILAHSPLGKPAVYVRGNTMLPLGPNMNFVGERPCDPLTLLVFPTRGEDEFTFYEDSGDGYAYRDGVFSRRRMTCQWTGDRIHIHIAQPQGSFAAEREHIQVDLRGITPQPRSVTVDGEGLQFEYDARSQRLTLTARERQEQMDIDVVTNDSSHGE